MQEIIEYINKNIDKTNSYNDALLSLNKIVNYLKEKNYINNIDNNINLINNSIQLSEILKIIVDNNIKLFQKNGLEKYFKDNVSIQLIESYCIIEGIYLNDYIKESEEINYDNIMDDPVGIYLKEISTFKRLTAEEEKMLGYRILEGDEKAKKLMAERNLKLVVAISKHFSHNRNDFLDIIQDGNIGLMRAVELFDVTKGYKFSTYATWWIRQAIIRGISEKSRTIKLPIEKSNMVARYNKMIELLTSRLSRDPNIEEIAEALSISTKEVVELQNLRSGVISLNSLIGDKEDEELMDIVPSEDGDPETMYYENSIEKNVQQFLIDAGLDEKQRYVIIHRLGLMGSEEKTLEELGQEFGCTRERIRQIEAKCLRKLSRSSYADKMAMYMEDPDEAIKRRKENYYRFN